MERIVRVLMLEEVEADAASVLKELAANHILCEGRRVHSKQNFLKELVEFRPHLVLSDYQTSLVDGLTILKLIRRTYKNLPFIFVSWIVHEETVVEAMRHGATDYVFKDQLSRLPFSILKALKEAEERSKLKIAETKMMEQERLNAFGQMAGGIAHDFSNALAPILGYSEALLEQPDGLDDKETVAYCLKIIHIAAKDAAKIADQLRGFYRPRRPEEKFAAVDLHQIVEFTILFTRPKWKNQALAHGAVVKVESDVPRLPFVWGDDAGLRECLTNLIFNAVDAMPGGGAIYFHGYPEKGSVVLEIRDTGVGMTPEEEGLCFEPFYSTKGERGTGLGLSMVRAVIEQHHGTIGVTSEKGKGTLFKIRLPQYHAQGVDALSLSRSYNKAA